MKQSNNRNKRIFVVIIAFIAVVILAAPGIYGSFMANETVKAQEAYCNTLSSANGQPNIQQQQDTSSQSAEACMIVVNYLKPTTYRSWIVSKYESSMTIIILSVTGWFVGKRLYRHWCSQK